MPRTLPVSHERFAQQALSVRLSGLLHGPQLLLNEVVLQPDDKGEFQLLDDQQKEVTLRLKARMLDPVPDLWVDETPMLLAETLPVFAWFWAGLPLLLLLGGAMGGILGVCAFLGNLSLLRSERPQGQRYAFAGLLSLASLVFYTLLTALLLAPS